MASRDDFTKDEWNVLATAPDAATLAVMAAQPGGAVEERETMFEAWRASSDQPFADNQLVLTLIRNRDAMGEEMHLRGSWEESLSNIPFEQARTRALDLCQKAAALLERKTTPADQQDYKRWVMFLSEKVAGAVRSGGGQVSESEQAILRDIANALKLNVNV